MDFKPGDRVRVTVKDVESGETDTLDATVIAIDSSGILVVPDDTFMGLLPTIFIKPEELIAIVAA